MNYSLWPNQLFLSIDQGGHASRAMVFNADGELVASSYHDLSPSIADNDVVEYDATQLLASINTCIEDILEQLGPRRQQLVAAGLATQRSNIVCWDRHTGAPLSPVISWQDRRNRDWLRQFEHQADRVHQLTGLYLSPHYGASKLRWCLEHLPEVQQAREEQRLMFGPMATYITRHLVREHSQLSDPVNASRTQLWSLTRHDWDDSLLELFGIPRECLPACAPTHHHYGHLTLAGDQNLPLAVVTGDQSAAMFAYGELQPDTAYVNMGTGAFISRTSGHAPLASRRLLTSVILQDEDTTEYVLEGTVNGAGAALDWLAQRHGQALKPEDLNHWLETEPGGGLFLNGISGVGAPFWVAEFASRFIHAETLPQQAVAVLESIVFLLQASLNEMRKLASRPEQIQISGGLAHNTALCQRLADLSGLPVYRPQECEATARGLAYLLAGQPRHWPEDAPGDWFEPRPQPQLRQRYQQWTEDMLDALRKAA